MVAVGFALAGCGHGSHRSVRATTAGAAEWKGVLGDWIADGRIDHPHSCAAVRAAVEHLPSSPPTYSTIGDDLRAYETKVC
jgi:hypothetical protein